VRKAVEPKESLVKPATMATSTCPALIIVTGSPCTGKTTLAQQLAASLSLPVMAKDTIKEALFETLGWSDRAWSRRLGGASMELLYLFAEALLAAGRSCIVEANFLSRFATPAFRRIGADHPFLPIQVLCVADPDVLVARFERRACSGERHSGHQDHRPADPGLSVPIAGRLEPLDIGGHLIELDTTDFGVVDYAGLCQRILRLWRQSSGAYG
jgi:predicted kinase